MPPPPPTVDGLIIYPVKACRGVKLKEAQLTEHGTLKHDRAAPPPPIALFSYWSSPWLS